MDECYCGNDILYSRNVIEEIAREENCDAIIHPDFCETGTFVLSVDVWLNIQRGSCECIPFDNDARTLRLYWNEHPIDTTPVIPRASDSSSFLLSVAALTSVLLAAFIFAVLKCRRIATRRRAVRRRVRVSVATNEQVTENYPNREQIETSGERIELSSSTGHVLRLSDRPAQDIH